MVIIQVIPTIEILTAKYAKFRKGIPKRVNPGG